MFLLQDIITYIRRLIKTPSNSTVPDNLIIDYINRFWIIDVDARLQLFDLKTKYVFQTQPGVDQYNMPLYSIQIEPGNQTIGLYPVYQGFLSPARVNGINVPWYTERSVFYDAWPNYVQSLSPITIGDGTAGPYQIQLPFAPNVVISPNQPASGILRGHVDITGIIATGSNADPIIGATLNLSVPTTSVYSAVYFTSINAAGANVIVADSGQFLTNNVNYGLLMQPGLAPFGNTPLVGGYSTTLNTINYNTGVANVTFPSVIPAGQNINAQCFFYLPGLPRAILYYNNILTLRNPPDIQYQVEIDAYLSPAAFLNTSASVPFGYMTEYISRGAARKILADTGDIEQFNFYEPLFREQEILVWKRSQRQWTSTRTQTLYSGYGFGNTSSSNGLFGSGAT